MQQQAHAGEQLCAQPGEQGGEPRWGEGGQAAVDEQRIRVEGERDGERKQRALLGTIALYGDGEAVAERCGRFDGGQQLRNLLPVTAIQPRKEPGVAASGQKRQQRFAAVHAHDVPADFRRALGAGDLARDQAEQRVGVAEYGKRRAVRELQRHIGQYDPPRLVRAPMHARKEQRQHALIGAFEIAIGDVCMDEPDHTGIFCMRAPFYERVGDFPSGKPSARLVYRPDVYARMVWWEAGARRMAVRRLGRVGQRHSMHALERGWFGGRRGRAGWQSGAGLGLG